MARTRWPIDANTATAGQTGALLERRDRLGVQQSNPAYGNQRPAWPASCGPISNPCLEALAPSETVVQITRNHDELSADAVVIWPKGLRYICWRNCRFWNPR